MGLNSISNFKSAFSGGTRQNRFRASIDTVPVGTITSDWDPEFTFKVSAAEMPQSTMGTVTVQYRGRPIIYAGDRQYFPWNLTIYDDSSTNGLWAFFNSWMEQMDGHLTHEQGAEDYSYSSYQCQMSLYQQDVNGNDIRAVYLYNAWPLTVGAIELDMGKLDPVSFTVQMVFDYIDIDGVTTE